LGGEYTNGENDSNTAEIYDPVANSWTAAATYPNQSGCPNSVFSVTGAVTLGSNVITGISPTTARILAGFSVTGFGIPSNTTVSSVDSLTQIHISRNATTTTTSSLTIIGVPAGCFGDDPSSLISGGTKILAGDIISGATYLYTIATDSWAATGHKVYNDPSDEEGWVKLPNGNVLNYDLFVSVATGGSYAEVYNPTSGTWSSISPSDGSATGSIPQLSGVSIGYELGPILRLQDGRVLLIGATQHTALYNPSTNNWAAGPDTSGVLSNSANPGGTAAPFGADDAPAAILPNGHVIFAADAGPAALTTGANTTSGSNVITGISSTATLQTGWGVAQANNGTNVIPANTTIQSVDSATQIHITNNAQATTTGTSLLFGGTFSPPTQLFDFNPSTNTISPVSPAISDSFLTTTSSYVTRMLVLPTGQLLFGDATTQMYIYTPDGTPPANLRPTVNSITYNGGGSFTLTGKQLNGQSAGSAYGDDVQQDENYPIVRMVSSTGKVFYARTTNWSSVDVAGGTALQTVNFTLNPSLTAGNYALIVSGAGISSFPILINITSTEVSGMGPVPPSPLR